MRSLFKRSSPTSGSSSRKSLRKLAKKRRWSDLLSALRTEAGRRRASAIELPSGEYLLHDVAMFDPPLEVVEELVEICPAAVTARGLSGCLPLHVAAAFGAHPAVIDALCGAAPGTAAARCGDGSTPLHLAVQWACGALREYDRDGNDGDGDCEVDRRLAVVSALHRRAPGDAGDERDGRGRTPIDLALSLGGEDGPVAELLLRDEPRGAPSSSSEVPPSVQRRDSCASAVSSLASADDDDYGGDEGDRWDKDVRRLREPLEGPRQRSSRKGLSVVGACAAPPLGPLHASDQKTPRPPAA